MKNVMVTGSDGFIGQFVVRRLEELGIGVSRFDIAGDIVSDITEESTVCNAIEDSGVDGVIHLAGILGTHELFVDVRSTVEVNVMGTINVMETLKHHKKGIPFVGIEQPHIWYNPYEASKMAARRYALAYAHAYDIPMSYVRAFNAYGPGQAPPGGGHPTKIIPAFSTQAWSGRPIEVWGDGTGIVDLVWVGDVADVLIDTLLTARLSGPEMVVEAGTGNPMTVNQVAAWVVDRVQSLGFSRPEVAHRDMRRGEQGSSRSSNTAQTNRQPFRGAHLNATIDWYRQFAT